MRRSRFLGYITARTSLGTFLQFFSTFVSLTSVQTSSSFLESFPLHTIEHGWSGNFNLYLLIFNVNDIVVLTWFRILRLLVCYLSLTTSDHMECDLLSFIQLTFGCAFMSRLIPWLIYFMFIDRESFPKAAYRVLEPQGIQEEEAPPSLP